MKEPLPKIALVGRPNVGKSALFNRLCGRRVSIVDEQEGVTRDRIYSEAECFGKKVQLIDTGGIDFFSTAPFNEQIKKQSELAIEEADVAILVVDGQVGLTVLDREIATLLHRKKIPCILAVNKMDCLQDPALLHEFYTLGIPKLLAVSATQGTQLADLLEAALGLLGLDDEDEIEEILETPEEDSNRPIRVAIAGRPNVGKSTLLNRLLGMERSIVSPIAGTTRDAIDAPLCVDGQDYLLIDTAGIRRKKSEKEAVDKFAAVRTQETLEKADVVLLVLDAQEGFTTQEKHIASEIERLGKSCILVFNKWDQVKCLKMEHALRGVREDLPFLTHCPALFLSALTMRNVDKILPAIKSVYADRFQRISTGALNKFVERCIQACHPPMLMGKRLRIYYMTQVEVAPPKFIFFVNQPHLMAECYRKYLINQFREAYRFSGCPILFELRSKRASAPKSDSGVEEFSHIPV